MSNGLATVLERGAGRADVPWGAFRGKRVLVTGATGTVGAAIVALLLGGTATQADGPTVYALSRNAEKARERFAGLPAGDRLAIVEGDVTDPASWADALPPCDLIAHAAARTDSAGMVAEPLAVIDTTLCGTRAMLELARRWGSEKLVFTSSMEVYGAYAGAEPLDEHRYGTVDPLEPRSSYPESKKMAEALCVAYRTQHGVPACIARLAQTFGPGTPADDRRLLAYLVRCAKRGEDIELATDGSSKRMYLSTVDAAAALLMLLAKGEPGEAYNVAAERTYCSIRELAELVTRRFASAPIEVRCAVGDAAKYPPNHDLPLDTRKLRALGWTPADGLEEILAAVAGAVE